MGLVGARGGRKIGRAGVSSHICVASRIHSDSSGTVSLGTAQHGAVDKVIAGWIQLGYEDVPIPRRSAGAQREIRGGGLSR